MINLLIAALFAAFLIAGPCVALLALRVLRVHNAPFVTIPEPPRRGDDTPVVVYVVDP